MYECDSNEYGNGYPITNNHGAEHYNLLRSDRDVNSHSECCWGYVYVVTGRKYGIDNRIATSYYEL